MKEVLEVEYSLDDWETRRSFRVPADEYRSADGHDRLLLDILEDMLVYRTNIVPMWHEE